MKSKTGDVSGVGVEKSEVYVECNAPRNALYRAHGQAGNTSGQYPYSLGTFSKSLGSGAVTFNFISSTACARLHSQYDALASAWGV